MLRDVQYVLKSEGYYSGKIDGIFGPQTLRAIDDARLAMQSYVSFEHFVSGSESVAVMQALLTKADCEPGRIDGLFGTETREALIRYRAKKGDGPSDEVVRKRTTSVHNATSAQLKTPRQNAMRSFYGEPGGPQCTAGRVHLPFPFELAWDRERKVNSFSCHHKVANAMTAIFEDAATHYGRAEFERLELHVFGGCYNFRKMRGGNKLSTHAYGVAVDLNPEKNQLRWDASQAQFAQPEYEPFWRIVAAHGGTPAGYAWGRDWMHFQFARL